MNHHVTAPKEVLIGPPQTKKAAGIRPGLLGARVREDLADRTAMSLSCVPKRQAVVVRDEQWPRCRLVSSGLWTRTTWKPASPLERYDSGVRWTLDHNGRRWLTLIRDSTHCWRGFMAGSRGSILVGMFHQLRQASDSGVIDWESNGRKSFGFSTELERCRR